MQKEPQHQLLQRIAKALEQIAGATKRLAAAAESSAAITTNPAARDGLAVVARPPATDIVAAMKALLLLCLSEEPRALSQVEEWLLARHQNDPCLVVWPYTEALLDNMPEVRQAGNGVYCIDNPHY